MSKLKRVVRALLATLRLKPPLGVYLEIHRSKHLHTAVYLTPEWAYLCTYYRKTTTWQRIAQFKNLDDAIKAAQYTNEKARTLPKLTLSEYEALFKTKYYGILGARDV